MMGDAEFVFVLIAVAGGMMASNRVRYDLVALIVVIALIVSGVLTSDEALSGFGSPVVIMVVGLLIVGEMLERTGIAHTIGNLILGYGGRSETRLTILLILGAALLGSVMSSTAVVAIFIPVILRIAADTGLQQSRLLLPMSYAALISGMLTLIATPPNLVVSDSLQEAGYEALGFFSFFPIGLVVLMSTIIYFLAFGRKLLTGFAHDASEQTMGRAKNRQSTLQFLDDYALLDQFHLVEVVSKPRADLEAIFHDSEARVLARSRPSNQHSQSDAFVPGMELLPGDQLLISGTRDELGKVSELSSFKYLGAVTEATGQWRESVGVADILVHPEAAILGKSVKEYAFRDTYGVDVIGVLRGGETLADPFGTSLKIGDCLLIAGPTEEIDAFFDRNHDFVLLRVPKEREERPLVPNKFLTSLLILAGMVALSVSGVVPVVVAVILAAVAAVLCRTISADRAYRSIHWSSIVLVAGMLPLADALQKTGGADMVVEALLEIAGDGPPQMMMAMLFAVTVGLPRPVGATIKACGKTLDMTNGFRLLGLPILPRTNP
ncbi:SLC13 family permease [Falsiruegeria mediterranea]|uniref:SLC13 family permease n=1 Tax=Falsiruegeria mediterranea TaxID=1280832 RepID=UPI0015F29BAB|nr:SLC13 family permease [Falsiruegeria mediterranea]